MIEDGSGKRKTAPAIAFGGHEPQANIFFRKSGEDLERTKEITDKLNAVKDKIGPDKLIVRHNSRLPSKFMLKLMEQEEKFETESVSSQSVMKNKFDFSVPLTKEEIMAAQKKKE